MIYSSPTICVLLSTHNDEKTLDRCFESLKNQTWQNFSLMCINDASTDSTSNILQKWLEIFGKERFSIITNQTNLGLTRSLNIGLASIDATYTARIDADDWWHSEKLQKQITFIEANPRCGLLGCSYKNISDKKRKAIRCEETDREIRVSIFKRNPFAHSCVLFNTSLVKKIGGYDETVFYGQDYDLWLRLMLHTEFYNLQEYLCFRSVDGGISEEKQNAQMWQCLKTQIKYLRLYHRPVWEYRFLLEPLLVIATPRCIRTWKRKWL